MPSGMASRIVSRCWFPSTCQTVFYFLYSPLSPMPTKDREPTGNQPDGQQQQREVRRVSMPVIVFDSTHAVAVSRKENGTLLIRVTSGGTPLFTTAVTAENDIHFVTPVNKKPAEQPAATSEQEQQPAVEQKELPALPITIEGYPVHAHSYDKEKQHYNLTIAHHPNPKDRKEVVYYDLVAEGEKAEEFYALRITETRTPVHVTGTDRSHEVSKKGKSGEKKMIHRVDAESIEKIYGRTDNSEVLREKVRLADQQ